MPLSNPTDTSYGPGGQFRPTSGYGTRTDPFQSSRVEYHPGQDYAAPAGTLISAAATGTVVYSGYNAGGYGNTVVIKSTGGDGSTFYTLYAHQNGNSMPALDSWVGRGEVIGEVGNTGRSTGAHLHFEVLNANATISHASG
ncbi:M23 family metallopeptidase [Pseudoduganella aquatica]|uniref:M23 family metallopeptidase n=1 Tax=Pseudoduganella aquatica TaxID=2660641 RepID=UPI001E471214|nr:M23 family metallopeptidase [Pseudoduganella aquatica]